MVELQGYNIEEHDVTSQDGYITRLTRIINPMVDEMGDTYNGQPVAIHHGLAQSPISPLLTFGELNMSMPREQTVGEIKSNLIVDTDQNHLTTIPYYLSDHGYDVWLLEARGSTSESRGHTNKSKTSDNQSDYWDFALDEQALYDLPAQIDYILTTTDKTKLAYVGYSQSTTFMLQLLSEKQNDYANKLAMFVAIAPVAYLQNTTGLIKSLSDLPGSKSYFSSETGPFLGSVARYHRINDIFVSMAKNSMSGVALKKGLEFGYGPDESHNKVVSTPHS